MSETRSRNSPLVPIVLAMMALSTSAEAQKAAPAPQIQYAPAIPGFCLVGREAVLGGSKAGQAGSQRLRQLQQQIGTELTPERQAIVQENAALQTGRTSLAPAVLQQRTAALQQRARKFNELDQLRTAQLERTRATEELRIANAIPAALVPAVARQKCAVLLERRTSYGFNPGMDITAAVIQEIDRTVVPTQFNLVTPDQLRAPK